MKSKVIAVEEQKSPKIEFPSLVVSTYTGLIVLALGPGEDEDRFTGLSIGFGPKQDGALWDYDSRWSKAMFVPFKGTVELSN